MLKITLIRLTIVILTFVAANSFAEGSQYGQPSEAKASLGGILFNDPSLSNPSGQSCGTCHQATQAFSDGLDVSPGANAETEGTRNAPSLMYLKYVPPFEYWPAKKTWVGGLFWDGRVDTFAEQAEGPLFNPIEMNNTPETLAKKLRNTGYFEEMVAIYGENVKEDNDALIAAATDALQHFQLTDTFAPFTSKFDYYNAGKVELTEEEELGRKIFDGKGACIDCHTGFYEGKQLFTLFLHHNILTPANPTLKVYQSNPKFVDEGTAAHPKLSEEEKALARGRFRTPTLRNVALTAPYMHNGAFKTLESVIDYYRNTEDRLNWGPAEVPENVSSMLTRRVDLDPIESEALIAFLHTLTDGYQLPKEKKQSTTQGEEKAR